MQEGASGFPEAAPSSSLDPNLADSVDADLSARDFSADDPRDEHGVVMCWTVRGCHGIWGVTGDYMEAHCPHNDPTKYSPCPATCAYTRCQRPWHREATNIMDLLDPDVDRMATIKEQCRHCLYFIKRGPRVAGAYAAGGDAGHDTGARRDASAGHGATASVAVPAVSPTPAASPIPSATKEGSC